MASAVSPSFAITIAIAAAAFIVVPFGATSAMASLAAFRATVIMLLFALALIMVEPLAVPAKLLLAI